MIEHIHAIRGIHDYLPSDTLLWNSIEATLKKVLTSYGYSEIRLPIIERTILFKRAVGEMTDVVEKEMYIFVDRNGDSLALRPEGTAGCVRAGIAHSLLSQDQRLWYIGPMFRYERPQKGRYRQFHQIGAETFGNQGPDIDAELIRMTARSWRALDIHRHISLELNSVGSIEARVRYREALIAFFVQNKERLDEEGRRRMYTNPMRILDTKKENIRILLNDAPVLTDYLDDDSRAHFSRLCSLLDQASIPYVINPHLVRGLDYYNRTVFEWVTTSLGAQGTICAGGRYDGLVEQLGGPSTPAAGFAIGLERLLLLMKEKNPEFYDKRYVDAYMVVASESNVQRVAMLFSEKLRDSLPNLRLMTHYSGGKFKHQFRRASKHGARIVLVLGEREVDKKQVVLKWLDTGKQEILQQSAVAERLTAMFEKKDQSVSF